MITFSACVSPVCICRNSTSHCDRPAVGRTRIRRCLAILSSHTTVERQCTIKGDILCLCFPFHVASTLLSFSSYIMKAVRCSFVALAFSLCHIAVVRALPSVCPALEQQYTHHGDLPLLHDVTQLVRRSHTPPSQASSHPLGSPTLWRKEGLEQLKNSLPDTGIESNVKEESSPSPYVSEPLGPRQVGYGKRGQVEVQWPFLPNDVNMFVRRSGKASPSGVKTAETGKGNYKGKGRVIYSPPSFGNSASDSSPQFNNHAPSSGSSAPPVSDSNAHSWVFDRPDAIPSDAQTAVRYQRRVDDKHFVQGVFDGANRSGTWSRALDGEGRRETFQDWNNYGSQG